MAAIKINLAEAANRDDPDFAALRQHPRYGDAVKILQARGLRHQVGDLLDMAGLVELIAQKGSPRTWAG